jgi:hypothetical protein
MTLSRSFSLHVDADQRERAVQWLWKSLEMMTTLKTRSHLGASKILESSFPARLGDK